MTISNRIVSTVAAAGATLLTCLSPAAYAAEGRWTQGFGQGNLEYFIDSRGWQFFIGCPTKDGSADALSGVSLHHIASGRQAKNFVIRVGGNEYRGPFAADSRVGTNNFISLLEDLRRTDAVVTHAQGTLTFPKSNVAQVVPVYGAKFKCNVD